MNCPPEVAEILVEMLQLGLLRIRALGWNDKSQRCAVEADHLHNLPLLLTHFSPDRLRFYWDVERPGFLSQSESNGFSEFEELWRRLAPLVACEPIPDT